MVSKAGLLFSTRAVERDVHMVGSFPLVNERAYSRHPWVPIIRNNVVCGPMRIRRAAGTHGRWKFPQNNYNGAPGCLITK